MARSGAGRMEYADSSKNGRAFEGQFEQDKREGIGYHFLSDGRVYCGQFRNDLEEGLGEYLNTSDGVDMQFTKVNKATIEQILDQITK